MVKINAIRSLLTKYWLEVFIEMLCQLKNESVKTVELFEWITCYSIFSGTFTLAIVNCCWLICASQRGWVKWIGRYSVHCGLYLLFPTLHWMKSVSSSKAQYNPLAEANESGSVLLFRASPQALLWKSLWLRPIPWDMTAIYYMPRIHDIYHGSESELLMNTVAIPGKCFERRVRQEDLWIKQFLRPLTYVLFVALCGGSICKWLRSKWWQFLIQMMATALSDPNEAGLKTTTATQGDSSWERNVPLWEPPVLNPYGSFLPLYGSSLHRGSFALNPYTGVFHPYTGVLRSMRCNSGTKFTPFALQTIPVDMYNTNTNTADNTSWYVH